MSDTTFHSNLAIETELKLSWIAPQSFVNRASDRRSDPRQMTSHCLFYVAVIATAVLGLFSGSAATAQAAAESDRPHVVIFVSDDMGWNAVGYHGSNIRTPSIDRLAREGMQLDRFYVHPICSPTRTAMMTGRSPARFGITSPLGGSEGVPTDERFLSEAFQDAGYQTFIVGKWHLGAVGDAYSPQARGFDHFYGCRGGVIDYYTHVGGGQLDWQRNGKPIEEAGYSTDLFAAEAVKLINHRNTAKPVFLYVRFNAPHGPVQAPNDLVQQYAAKGGARRDNSYAAAIDSMDQAIGKILNAIEQQGMTKNTLVLFFCDNGGKDAGGRSQGGLALRGGKGELLEGGVRVPAVIRWPGQIPSGTNCKQMISDLDLLPTLTSAAGIPMNSQKPLDGTDMWPAIRSDTTVSRPAVLIAGQRGEFAVIQDPLKLIHGADGDALYDIRQDPTESIDLAAARPQDVTRMKTTLEPFAKLNLSPNGRKRPGQRRRPPENRKPGRQGR